MRPHFREQVTMYRAGRYRKVNFTRDDVERNKDSVRTLTPAK